MAATSKQDTNTSKPNTTKQQPARKRAPRKVKPAEVLPFSATIQAVATARKMNATDAGKRTRGYVRGHRDDLVKVWPALAEHSKGDRYNVITREGHDAIIAALTPSAS